MRCCKVNPAPQVYTHAPTPKVFGAGRGFGAIPFGNILPFIPAFTDGAFWWCGVKTWCGVH
ncbi:MAG: hypothetical protein AB1606_02105 [Nitrospirota bacterium]